MTKKKLILVAFVLLLVTTFAFGANSFKKADAASVESLRSEVNSENSELIDTVELSTDDYKLENGSYNKTLENGDYSVFYMSSSEPVEGVEVNGESISLEAGTPQKIDIAGLEKVEISIPEASMEKVETAIHFDEELAETKTGSPSNIEYAITYSDSDLADREYYLSLSATNGEMVKVYANPESFLYDESFVQGNTVIDENAMLFSSVTTELRPIVSFYKGSAGFPSTISYEVIDDNFNVDKYEVNINEENFKEETRLDKDERFLNGDKGIDYGDAPSSYGNGAVFNHNGAQFMNFYHLDEFLFLGQEMDTTPKGDVDDDSYSATSNALGDGDDELGYVTAVPRGGLNYTVSTAPGASNMAYIYPRVRSDKGENVDVGVWIDYDGNGTFDSDEGTILRNSPTSKVGETIRYPLDLSEFATNNVTDTYLRMRVVSSNANMTSSDANTDYSNKKYDGETEDHSLKISRDNYDANVCYSDVTNDPAWNLSLKNDYGDHHKIFQITNGPSKGAKVDIQTTGQLRVIGAGTGGYTNVNPQGLSSSAQKIVAEDSTRTNNIQLPFVISKPNESEKETRNGGLATITVTNPDGTPMVEPFTFGVGDIDVGDKIYGISTSDYRVTDRTTLKPISGGYKGHGLQTGEVDSYVWMNTSGGRNSLSFNIQSDWTITDGLVKMHIFPLKTHWLSAQTKVDCPTDVSKIETSKSFSDSDGDGKVEANENDTFTIKVENKGSKTETVTVKDDLLNQDDDFSLVYDLSNLSAINVNVSGATPTPTNPTLADLVNGGVTFNIGAGGVVEVSYTLHSKNIIPDDITGDSVLDNDITNVATVSVGGGLTQKPEITVPIQREDVAESLTKTVKDADSSGVAQAGEKLTYTINYTANSNSLELKDDIDENLNIDTVKLYSFKEDGVEVNTSLYTKSLDKSTRQATLAYKAGQAKPGANYEVVYTVDVANPLANSSATKINNHVKETNTGLEANVDIPLEEVVVEDPELKKSVTDADSSGIAEPGETLTYTIELHASGDSFYLFDDVDENLDIKSFDFVAITEDGRTLPNSSFSVWREDSRRQVYFRMEGNVKPGSDYKMIYQINVEDPLVNKEATIINNHVLDRETGLEADVDIPLEDNEVNEMTKTVTDGNGNTVAEPGEYLTYTINFQSGSDKMNLIDDIDKNLDISTIDLISFTEDGVPVSPTRTYGYKDTVTRKVYFGLLAGEAKEDAVYQIVYTIQVTKPLENPDATLINNYVKEPNTGLDATVDIPVINIQNNEISKTVSDDTNNGLAQPGERLEYSIEYHASDAKEFIIIEDLLDDPNLIPIPMNIRVLEDDVVLTQGVDYDFLPNNQVYIMNIKEGSDYDIIFDVDVKDPLADPTRPLIENTATEKTEDISNDADIKISTEEIVDSSNISKDVEESTAIGIPDGDGKADPEEFLHYTIKYESNLSKNRVFFDVLDKNLDVSTLTNLEVKVDGEVLDPTEYTYNEDTLNNVFIIEYPGYMKESEVEITFDIQVFNPLVNEEPNVVTNIITENTSGVDDDAVIELDKTVVIPEQEELLKEVIGSTSVTPGDNVQYRLTIGPLQTEVSSVRFIDNLENDYLSYVSVDGVYVNGVSASGSTWTNASTDSVDVTVTNDFVVGDVIELEFTANLSESTPENITVGNVASGYSGEYETNDDTADVTTGPSIVLPVDSAIYTDKTIISEAGGSIDDQAEVGERITYQIKVENITDVPVDVLVKDDLYGLEMDKVYNFSEDDIVNIGSDLGLVETKTLGDLITGFNMTLQPHETIEISFTLTVKEIIETPDINPADGNPDERLLNTAYVQEVGKNPLYPGIDIGLPAKNGDLVFLKAVNTHDEINGTDYLDGSGDIAVDYTLTVVNKGTTEAKGLYLSDDLIDQGFEPIFDLSSPESIPLTVTSPQGTIVTPDPTLADLMSEDGVEITVPTGDFPYTSVGFTLTSKVFDPATVSDPSGYAGNYFRTNSANLYDATTDVERSASRDLYFSEVALIGGEFKFYDPNDLGMYINGMPMRSELTVRVNQEIEVLEGYITYDKRYENYVRPNDFTVLVSGEKVPTENFELITTGEGNQSYTTFRINYDFNPGDQVIIRADQTIKTTDATRLGKSANMAKLITKNYKSDTLMSEV